MPFALIFVAAILIVTGFRGTTSDFLSTFAGDVKGFLIWIVVIGVIGGIGYVPGMKKLSDAFLALVLLVLFLTNKGFFANFNNQIKNLPAPATPSNSSTPSASSSTSSSSGLPDWDNMPLAVQPDTTGSSSLASLPSLPLLPSLSLDQAGSLP